MRDGNLLGTLTNDAVAANPILFTTNGTGYGASAWYPDGTPNSPDHPAKIGDTLIFYGTGVGNVVSPLPDGSIPTSAHAISPDSLGACGVTLYAGDAPGQIEGIVQVNCQVPGNAPVTLAEPGFVGSSENYLVYYAQ